uniref:G-protein coupled receptors family 1 profile domain-containing protein n=1 Tax=Plectus sambesii TaxID=2011161 RepID=A0A914WL27_9BILA
MHFLPLVSFQESKPNKGVCLAASFLAVFGVTLSQLMTVAIGLDRHSAISSPIAYRKRDHKVLAVGSFGVIFLYGAVTCSLLFVGVDLSQIPDQCGAGSSTTKPWTIYWGLFGLIVCSVVCVTYLLTLRKFRQLARARRDQQMSTSMSKREKAVHSTVSTILLIYIVLFGLPNVAYVIAVALWEDAILISPYILLGSALNSSVNVLVYAVKHNDIRASMLVSFGVNDLSTRPSSLRSPRLPPVIADNLVTGME